MACQTQSMPFQGHGSRDTQRLPELDQCCVSRMENVVIPYFGSRNSYVAPWLDDSSYKYDYNNRPMRDSITSRSLFQSPNHEAARVHGISTVGTSSTMQDVAARKSVSVSSGKFSRFRIETAGSAPSGSSMDSELFRASGTSLQNDLKLKRQREPDSPGPQSSSDEEEEVADVSPSGPCRSTWRLPPLVCPCS